MHKSLMKNGGVMKRFEKLQNWCQEAREIPNVKLTSVVGDASFRQYFRLHEEDADYIVMDAPPAVEDPTSFIEVQNCFFNAGIRVPKIFAKDRAQGFILMEDFGSKLYHQVLNEDNMKLL